MDDDDNERNNEVRRGLVGPIESIVAVLPDRKYKQNFWVYKVTEKQETTVLRTDSAGCKQIQGHWYSVSYRIHRCFTQIYR